MLDLYDDPDGFRANLNATIEALRNVTFMLQNEKQTIPGFDVWYDEWRKKMKTDAVMTWLCKARTIVVHNSDIETRSSAHAIVHNNLTLAKFNMELPPLLPTPAACELIACTLPATFSESLADLVLSVERRWVTKQLDKWELLDALGHAYGILSQLVRDAHERAGFSYDTRDNHGTSITTAIGDRLPCMITTVEARTARIRLANRQPIVSHGRAVPTNPQHAKKAVKRYGLDKFAVSLSKEADPFKLAESLLPVAKQILMRDKYHVRIMFMRTPQHWTGRMIDARDQTEKYTLMRTIANEIHRLQVDALIEISEAWVSSMDEMMAGRLPADARDRSEALAIIVATSDGKYRDYVTPFKRNILGQIKFEKTKIMKSIPNFLAPIFEIWGKKLPNLTGD